MNGRECIVEEFAGETLDIFLNTESYEDDFLVETVMNILYAIRFVLNQSDMPFGLISLTNIYVKEEKIEAKMGLPEFRTIVQKNQITIADDLRRLSTLINTISSHAKKSNVEQVLRYCSQLCLNRQDVGALPCYNNNYRNL